MSYSLVWLSEVLAPQICQPGVNPLRALRLLSRQKGLSLSIIAVLSSLGLQELDELVENSSKCSAQEGANPVNPVRTAKVERDQVRAEGPGRVKRTTGVIDTRQPVII